MRLPWQFVAIGLGLSLVVACSSSSPDPAAAGPGDPVPVATPDGSKKPRPDMTPLRATDAGGEAGCASPCLIPAPTWSCASSAYQGRQYWTCKDGNIYKCDASGPVMQRCANGCLTGPLATDDACKGPPSPGPAGFLLPLACNATETVTQGNNGPYSHTGFALYAFDFGLGLNTPLHATQDGVVNMARSDVGPGNPCYSGGGSGCANTVNYVVLDHGDGTATLYLHLNAATVSVGQVVKRGDQVGLSGGTGWSTGPHAHIQRQGLCGSWWCQSVPLSFADVPGGVPVGGQRVTSKNGC